MGEQRDYCALMSLGIEEITEEIAKDICSIIGLHSLVKNFLEDKHNLLFRLLDIEGITSDIAEKIIFSIGISLDELGHINEERNDESGTIEIPCYLQ
jgi:hypothetical protein